MTTAQHEPVGDSSGPAKPITAAAPFERAHFLAPSEHDRGWLIRRLLVAADLVGVTLAFVLAELLSSGSSDGEMLGFFFTIPLWVVLSKVYGLYDRDEERADHSTADDLVGVFHLTTVTLWLLLALSWATGLIDPSVPKLLIFWFSAICLITGGRAIVRVGAHHQASYLQNALVVGAGQVGQMVAKKFVQHPEYGVRIVGFLDDAPRERDPAVAGIPILGSPAETQRFVVDLDIQRVIVAFSNEPHAESLTLLRALKEENVQVDVVPRLFEMIGSRSHLHNVEGIPLMGLPPLRLSWSWRVLKRLIDIVGATLGLLLLAPLLVAIGIAVKLDSSGRVLFRQLRMGQDGRPFLINKFRTMVPEAEDLKPGLVELNELTSASGDPRMFKLPSDPRVTRVGRFLRKSALDELPQLLNVVKGDMSLVGPRPLIPQEDERIAGWGRQRLELKPGMTGPWQALGASSIPFDEMLRLDYLYITNWSLYGDFKWMWRTLPSLMRGRESY